MRALPFQHFRRGLRSSETTASRRCSARSRAAGPSARRRGRRRSRAPRATSPRPCRSRTNAVLPADQATAPSGRARRDRSSGASRRWRAASLSPLASIATTLPSSPPVTTRAPSAAADRMPPPCTATRCSSPSARRAATLSSPSDEGSAVRPRKCTATTGAPARDAACTRSATEDDGVAAIRSIGVELRSSRAAMQLSKPLRIFSSGRLRPMKTRRLSRFSPSFQARWWSPSRIMCTPWNTKRSGSSLKARMPLQRRMFGPSLCDQVLDPGKELVGIERLVGLERDRLHVLVVIVLEAVP